MPSRHRQDVEVHPYSVLTSALDEGWVATLPPGNSTSTDWNRQGGPRASPDRLYSTQSCVNVKLEGLSTAGGEIVISCSAAVQLWTASALSCTSCTNCKHQNKLCKYSLIWTAVTQYYNRIKVNGS